MTSIEWNRNDELSLAEIESHIRRIAASLSHEPFLASQLRAFVQELSVATWFYRVRPKRSHVLRKLKELAAERTDHNSETLRELFRHAPYSTIFCSLTSIAGSVDPFGQASWLIANLSDRENAKPGRTRAYLPGEVSPKVLCAAMVIVLLEFLELSEDCTRQQRTILAAELFRTVGNTERTWASDSPYHSWRKYFKAVGKMRPESALGNLMKLWHRQLEQAKWRGRASFSCADLR